MKKIYSLLLFSLFSLTQQAQTYVLFSENFETSSDITASLNDTLQIPTGPNRWIINNKYDGQSLYPNTPSQDSTYSGTIYNAPYSTYLHIHDSVTAYITSGAVANSNFNPSVASDNFVIIDTNGICAMGMDTVYVSFFYTCVGSPDAYAELYYSTNGGGSWTQVGQPKYNNRAKWQYELITDPGFANVPNLIFGFRWVNNNGSPPATTSFGIDDFIIAGHSNPNLTSISITPSNDTVCIGQYLFLTYSLSAPMCQGWYQIQMSDLTGNFIMPTPFYVFPINPPFTAGALAIFIPNSVFPGNCYRFTFSRISPTYPPIFIDTTICIVIQNCPQSITTCPLGPPVVTLDPNPVCAGSVIDVEFYSTGTFTLNTYKLQLSDVNGNFVHPDSAGAILIGSNVSDITYDPLFPTPGNLPPGSVGGIIPDSMSPGCNYKLRVIATGPAIPPAPLIGTEWGPFCIQHCDIITNNKQDIGFSLCLLGDSAIDCVTIPFNVNFYDSTITYGPGNQFMVQVLSRVAPPAPMTQVGPLGCLGSVTANSDGTLQLCIGPISQMLAWGILPNPPKSYYLRIVATNSSNPANSFGSVVRFQYGYLKDDTPDVAILDFNTQQPITYTCFGDVVQYSVTNPPNPPLQNGTSYEWSGAFVGSPSVRSYPAEDMFIIFTQNGNYTYPITCTQVSGVNCRGFPRTVSIQVYGKPTAAITGPPSICLGDTIKYQTVFQNGNFYLWNTYSTHTTITDTANNQAWFTFDSIGTYQISVYVSNLCFDTLVTRTITVLPYPIADAGLDSVSLCIGDTITLATSPVDSGWTYRWTRSGSTILLGTNDTLIQSPTTTTTYVIQVNNGICIRRDTIKVKVEQPPETDFSDTVCVDLTPIVLDPGISNATYLWYDNSTAQQHTVTDAGTYSVEITVPGEVCPRIYNYVVGYVYPDSSEENTFLCYGDPLTLDAGETGATYLWNTNETTAQISITTPGTYWVEITSPNHRCSVTRTFYAMDVPDSCQRNFTLPNVFTPNGDTYNDNFHALTYGSYHDFLIKIFNRWGELVFESTDQYFKWDGTNKEGKQCTEGVYYYVGNLVHPEDTRPLHGFVTLIRNK